MASENAVIELLRGLVAQADSLQVYYQKKFWNLGEPNFPVSGGIRFVRDQLKALETEVAKGKVSDAAKTD